MTTGTIFDSTKQSLQDLLKDIDSGKIQLPDSQAGLGMGRGPRQKLACKRSRMVKSVTHLMK